MQTTQKFQVSRFVAMAALALLANVILFYLGQSFGATFDVKAPTLVTAVAVIIATIFPLALGLGLLKILSKRLPKAVNPTIWVGLVVAIATTPGGWFSSNDVATGLALGAMHLTTALAWWLGTRTNQA